MDQAVSIGAAIREQIVEILRGGGRANTAQVARNLPATERTERYRCAGRCVENCRPGNSRQVLECERGRHRVLYYRSREYAYVYLRQLEKQGLVVRAGVGAKTSAIWWTLPAVPSGDCVTRTEPTPADSNVGDVRAWLQEGLEIVDLDAVLYVATPRPAAARRRR